MSNQLTSSTTAIFEPRPAQARVTWLWALPLLLVAFFILGQILAIIPIFESGLSEPDNIENYPDILLMLFGPFGMTAILLFAWVAWFEKRPLSSIGMQSLKTTKHHLLQGYGVGLLMAGSIVLTVWGLGGYQLGEQQTLTFYSLIPVIFLFFGFTVQSSAEELLFRGWLLGRVTEKKGQMWGIAINSAMFAILHLMAYDFDAASGTTIFIFVLMTLLFSVFLSVVTIKQGSVWFACGWHAGWNWFFISGFGLATTGIDLKIRPLLVNLDQAIEAPILLSGGVAGPENSIITTVVFLLAITITVKKLKKD